MMSLAHGQADLQKEKKKDREREEQWRLIEAQAKLNPKSQRVAVSQVRPMQKMSFFLEPRSAPTPHRATDSFTAAPSVEAAMRRKSVLPSSDDAARALREFHMT